MIYQKHPNHGHHMAANSLEAEANIKAGWVTVTETEFWDRGKKAVESVSSDLSDKYEAKFGKRPHHKMKPETIEAALREQDE